MMRRDYFVFGDINSLDYDVWLTGAHTEDAPGRDISTNAIPGRNGDLLFEQNRWKNIDITYSAAILRDFISKFSALKAGLLSQTGYQRLEDTAHPNEFRMAFFCNPIMPDNTPYNRAGKFDLTFCCKPQRYLKIGEQTVSFTDPGVLRNITRFTALPIIKVYGTGSGKITVGRVVADIKSIDTQMILDCDLHNAYQQLGEGAPVNMNGSIFAPTFPALQPGENVISWNGDIERVEIIPRWWTL